MSSFGLFITGTGTEIGKTFVTRGIACFLSNNGYLVSAIKPIETGCNPYPLDAISLSIACRQPHLANARGFFRSSQPLSPFAVSLCSDFPSPDIKNLIFCIKSLSNNSDVLLVESAGGLLVPLNQSTTNADLAISLNLPLLVIAPNSLGVISHTLTLIESALIRHLDIIGVVLVDSELDSIDLSSDSNHIVLGQLLPFPIFRFPFCSDDDDSLAIAADSSGVSSLILSLLSSF